MRRRAAALALALGCAPVAAMDLNADDSAALGKQIGAVLRATPRILAPVRDRVRALSLPRSPSRAPRPADILADAAAQDRAAIAAQAAALFDPALPGFGPATADTRVAFFTRRGCARCARAERDLRDLAARHGIRVSLIDLDRHPRLAAPFGFDREPAYVLPGLLLQGHMPQAVLERYLTRP